MLLSKRLYWTCDKFSLLQTPGLDLTIFTFPIRILVKHTPAVWSANNTLQIQDIGQSPGPHVTIIMELWRANTGLRTS